MAVEYSQHEGKQERNYSLSEFANDVVYLMQEISKRKGVAEPDIFTESGRYIAASHAVLVAPVLELFSQEYMKKGYASKKTIPHSLQSYTTSTLHFHVNMPENICMMHWTTWKVF